MTLGITWVGHSTVLVEQDGVRLLTDPVLGRRAGPLVRVGPLPSPSVVEDVDAILLSHLHLDHADRGSLRQVSRSAVVLAPHGSAGFLADQGFTHARELMPGEETAVGSLQVTAAMAVHDGRRSPLAAPASAIGFVVRGSRAWYFAGDTDLFDGMRELAGTIDVALLPVWGWGRSLGAGHLDPVRAAEAVVRIAPRVAIPIHWGTLAAPRPLPRIEDQTWPAREFARLVAHRAPEVEVRVLEPGERTEVA